MIVPSEIGCSPTEIIVGAMSTRTDEVARLGPAVRAGDAAQPRANDQTDEDDRCSARVGPELLLSPLARADELESVASRTMRRHRSRGAAGTLAKAATTAGRCRSSSFDTRRSFASPRRRCGDRVVRAHSRNGCVQYSHEQLTGTRAETARDETAATVYR